MPLFAMNDTQMAALMGFSPPQYSKQRDAYFRVFQERVRATFGEGAVTALYLIAGSAPSAFEVWMGEQQARNSAAVGSVKITRRPRRRLRRPCQRDGER